MALNSWCITEVVLVSILFEQERIFSCNHPNYLSLRYRYVTGRICLHFSVRDLHLILAASFSISTTVVTSTLL